MFHKTLLTLTAALALPACGTDDPGVAGGDGAEPNLPPVAKYEQQRQPTRVQVTSGGRDDGPVADWVRPSTQRATPAAPTLETRRTGLADEGGIRLPEPQEPRVAEDAAPDPRAHLYREGELCTHPAAAWAGPCEDDPSAAGCLVDDHLGTLLPDGITLGRGEKHFVLTGAVAIRKALPASGLASVLHTDQVDPPASHANRLAGELAALHLNIAYDRNNRLGTAELEGATMLVGPLQGWSVAHIAELAEVALGGDDYLAFGAHLSRADLADELATINNAAPDCVPDDFLSRIAP